MNPRRREVAQAVYGQPGTYSVGILPEPDFFKRHYPNMSYIRSIEKVDHIIHPDVVKVADAVPDHVDESLVTFPMATFILIVACLCCAYPCFKCCLVIQESVETIDERGERGSGIEMPKIMGRRRGHEYSNEPLE